MIANNDSAVDIDCGASHAVDLARNARAQGKWRLAAVGHDSREVSRFRALFEMLAEVVKEVEPVLLLEKLR
jgi:hypothetical protein